MKWIVIGGALAGAYACVANGGSLLSSLLAASICVAAALFTWVDCKRNP